MNLYARGLPVVAFRFTDAFKETYPDIKQEWIQHLLRQSGWIVPNYALSPNLEKIEILRVVVRLVSLFRPRADSLADFSNPLTWLPLFQIRESMTGDMMERLLEEIIHV